VHILYAWLPRLVTNTHPHNGAYAMLFTIAYQSKWEHQTNFNDAPALLQVEATHAAMAEWEFCRIWQRVFGNACKYKILTIAPPQDATQSVVADCFYHNHDNRKALQTATIRKLDYEIRARGLPWKIGGEYHSIDLVHIDLGNTNIIGITPRYENEGYFTVMHVTDDYDSDAKNLGSDRLDFVWQCNPERDARAWVDRLIAMKDKINAALATPSTHTPAQ